MNTTPLVPPVDHGANTDVVPAIKVQQGQISQSLHTTPDLYRLLQSMKMTYNIAVKTQLRALEVRPVDPIQYVARALFMSVNAFYARHNYSMDPLVVRALQELHALSQGRYVIRRNGTTGKDTRCKSLDALTDAAALFAQHEASQHRDVAAALEGARCILISTAFV